MKKFAFLALLSLALALPSLADEERHQSWISYDDGGTVIRTGDDGREVEAQRNVPVYPGDQIVTSRRGRTEVRLSDGNVVGIDRATAVRFRSILDSYEGDGSETVAELSYGKVAVYRTDVGRDYVRLDTDRASYVAYDEGMYSVETDSRGIDRVSVLSGSLEVRTPQHSTRVRAGESASVDQDGVYDLVGHRSADEFEQWFVERWDHYSGRTSRYLDRRLGYWADDLDDHGSWVMVSGIGWSWRPVVSVGWRPYYNGYWYHRNGCLTWVSYDPFGWVPYHYGRWTFDPGYGWLWVPGYGYSPAWVYWMYGSGYVGWAPAGWWDCYRPYYDWAYRPYRHGGVNIGFGFYGRVHTREMDLRPWTFVDPNTLISNRIDRAALTADAIKQRLGRSGNGYSTISGSPARFTREEFRDPAEAIRRRALDGRSTGAETGAPPTDMTPFFRRDSNLGGAIRERVSRERGGSISSPSAGSSGSTISRGTPSRGSIGSTPGASRGTVGTSPGATRGSIGSIDRGGSRGTGGTTSGSSGGATTRDPVRTIGVDRGDRGAGGETNPSRGSSGDSNWRDRMRDRGSAERAPAPPPSSSSGSRVERPSAPPAPPAERLRSDSSWRSRVRSSDEVDRAPVRDDSAARGGDSSTRGSDVPRRVIDGIGGARVYPRDVDRGSTRDSGRSSGGSTRDSGRSSGGSTRDSGGSRDSGRSSGSTRSSGSSSSGNRDSGGHVDRHH